MTFNQQLIQKARKGEIAILNDGSVEELREVLKETWPYDDVIAEGKSQYYYQHPQIEKYWARTKVCPLPAHSVKDFFMDTNKLNLSPQKQFSDIVEKGAEQPRTYRVTRQQMKEIWEAAKTLSVRESIRDMTDNWFDTFEDTHCLKDVQIMAILGLSEPPVEAIRSVFKEYFHIPEGEPVLYKCDKQAPYRIGVSNGKGHVYLDHQTEGLTLTVHNVIPFTKNPPK